MKLKEIFSYVLIGGLLGSLFIPFIVSDTQLFPFISGKGFTFRILTEILFGVWLVGMVWDSTLRPRLSWIIGALTAFVAIILVADIVGLSFFKSFWSNFERMDGYITLLHVYMYFLVASSALSTRLRWHVLFNTSVMASVIMSIYAFMQYGGKLVINQGGVRVDGTFGNATYLAVYMLFNIFITLFLLLRSYQVKNMINWPMSLWYGAALICQGISLYLTATRGAILGLLGGLLVFALIVAIFERGRPKMRKTAIGVLVALLVLVGGFFAIRNTDFVRNSPTLNRFASLSVSEIKSQGRRFVWPMAIEGFKERPVLGWGQENFNYVFNKNYDPRMYSQEPWFDRAHNIVLDWLVAGGALGLLGYLSIFAALLVLIWKSQTFSVTDKAVLVALTAAYFFQNLFVFDNLVSYMYFFLLLAFVHSEYVRTKSEPALLSRFMSPRFMKVAMPVIAAVLVIGLIYSWNVRQIIASREIIKALNSEFSKTADQSLSHFEEVYAQKTFADGEAVEQMVSQLNKFADPSVNAETRQKFVTLALTKLDQQIKSKPDDARTLLFMGSFRNRINDSENALPYLMKAHEVSPKKQSILFEIGFVHLSVGRYKEALAAFKEAYDLAPEFTEAQVLYGISALYAKDLTLANEIFGKIDAAVLAADERVILAYHNTGHTMDAIKLLESRVAADPNRAELRFRVAAGYLAANMRAKAVEVLREAGNRFPEVKQQADYYIKEIQAGRNP